MEHSYPLDPCIYLLNRCACGDQKAFIQLYRLSAPKLYSLALSILRREDWAEDILQEGFFSIWIHAGEYRPEKGAALSWMARIVRNLALDSLRRSKRETPLDTEGVQGLWSDTGLNLRQSLMRSVEAQTLRHCLEQLQTQQRQIITLAYFHGLTHKELAQQMSIPLGTIKTWIRRGLDQIRKCLDHEVRQP